MGLYTQIGIAKSIGLMFYLALKTIFLSQFLMIAINTSNYMVILYFNQYRVTTPHSDY
jgi:hypothetical protein